jgi:hypothetical protein
MQTRGELKEKVVTLVASRADKLNLDSDANFQKELVDEVEQSIGNYCNRDALPEELQFDWTNMTIDLLRWYDSQTNDSGSGSPSVVEGPMIVSSVTEGSVSIGLKSANEQKSSPAQSRTIAGVLDEIVMNYRDHLNRFRRLSW